MIVKTWKNKSHGKKNATFGIRISKKDVPVFTGLIQINLHIDGIFVKTVDITKGFHKKCPEIRDSVIKDFFIQNNLGTWTPGKPHVLNLTQINHDTFNLTKK